MASRAATLTIAAIIAVCAALGVLDSLNGALTLAPFLLLVAPLLAGVDPASSTVDKLIDLFGTARLGRAAPRLVILAFALLRPGLIAWKRLRARGPPVLRFT